MYGPTEEDNPVSEEEAHLVLGVLAKWYHSMMATKTAYQPFVRPTFTNRRKIAEGKQPTYDWRTVVIDGKAIKREHKGGTTAEATRAGCQTAGSCGSGPARLATPAAELFCMTIK